jgi:hypothetical protein
MVELSLRWTGSNPAAPERSLSVFDVFCQSCSRRRLVFAGQVRGISNDEAGIHVTYLCWCGALGTWSTGARHGASLG